MDLRLFHRRLFEAADALIPRGTTVVCAVSGGADSMALLHGLVAVNEIHECRWRLHVAHLDHGMRPDSASVVQFVRDHAASLKLPFTAERIDVTAFAKTSARSFEEAGRDARYEFLRSVAEREGAAVVAVAHHADDQAETVLHRIARGTGIRGLAGMGPARQLHEESPVRLVRPMLAFRRKRLKAYLDARSIEHREDATNLDITAAARNRIRHQVIPALEESLNPKIARALARLARHARRADEAIRLMAKQAMDSVVASATASEVRIDAAALAALPEAVQCEVVHAALRSIRVGMKKIGFDRIEAAANASRGDGRRRIVELAAGVVVERRGRWLRVAKDRSRLAPAVNAHS